MDCSISECDRPIRARGWCNPHWQRWNKHGDPLAGKPIRAMRPKRPRGLTEAEAFAWFMPGEPPIEGCWDWTGGVHKDTGYGQLNVGDQNLAHVISYRLHHGPTGGLFVLHQCDRPICVHPVHLHLGDQTKNMREAVERDRWAVGERHGMARLNDSDILTIRSSPLCQKELALNFGVAQPTISNIINRVTWKHI